MSIISCFPTFVSPTLLWSKGHVLLTFYISSFLFGGLKLMFQRIVLALLFKTTKCYDYRRCWGYTLLHVAICSNVMTMWTKSTWTKPCKTVLPPLICHFIFQNCNLINQPLASVLCCNLAVRINRNAGKFVSEIKYLLPVKTKRKYQDYFILKNKDVKKMLQLSQTIFYGQVNFRIIHLHLKFHVGFSNLKLHTLLLQSCIVTK